MKLNEGILNDDLFKNVEEELYHNLRDCYRFRFDKEFIITKKALEIKKKEIEK